MFSHYLKIAFRNLRKYKMQTIISIIGLAVGFVCFALSALWLRYERSFDAFHPNAHNLYVITRPSVFSPHGFDQRAPFPMAGYLRNTFPEVKNATHTGGSGSRDILWNGVSMSVDILFANDLNILDILNIRTLQGQVYLGVSGTQNFAISASKARQLFGDENPIGQVFYPLGENTRIVAIVSDMPRPSNFPFDFISLEHNERLATSWVMASGSTIMELLPNINKEAFFDRLLNHTIIGEHFEGRIRDVIPLTRVRYQDPNVNMSRNVQYEYILLFSLVGLLVILCSLFNYFTLFFTRFRLRQKEFALRMVCGATFKSLFLLLATEILTVMLFASALGLLMAYLFQPTFLEMSEIDMPLFTIFGEITFYWLGIILLTLFSFFVMLLIFRKRSLSASIRKRKNTVSRKASVTVQLMISIFFAFCTIVMIKQLHDLTRPGNLGFEFHNTAAVIVEGEGLDAVTIQQQLMQIPGITEVLVGYPALMPTSGGAARSILDWEGKMSDDAPFNIRIHRVSEAFIEFYRLQLVEGELLTDNDARNVVMINEAAQKRFGWIDAVGKTFDDYTVKGVIRNISNASPAHSIAPTYYYVHRDAQISPGGWTSVIIRYQGISFYDVRSRVESLISEEFPGLSIAVGLRDAEATFAEFIQSERALMRLLGFVSLVCILISVFGFFSLVSLTCEERRKEIAIRKVNGATIHDIVGIFFKEYALLLLVGALIAFPIGYYIMQRWLEQYVIQTSIDAWIYAAILLALTLVIVLCVGWRVWKASIENPADVVKSE